MKLPRVPRRRRARVILAAGAAATAGLLAVSLQSSSARAASAQPAAPQAASVRPAWTGGTRPVIVLEHGAWADSSSWDGVIAVLQRAGFTVYAPPDPLRGL